MAKKVEIGPYSAYALSKKYGYQGTEEEWINEQEQNRIASEQAANRAEAAASESEINKQSSENNKIEAQNAAVQAQLAKEGAESASSDAESYKNEAQQASQTASGYASSAEASKIAAEQSASVSTQNAADTEKDKQDVLAAKQDVESNKNLVDESLSEVKGYTQTAQEAAAKAEEAQIGLESAISEIDTLKEQAISDINTAKTSSMDEINQASTVNIEDITSTGTKYVSDITNLKNESVQSITDSRTQSISEIGESKDLAIEEINTKNQEIINDIISEGNVQVERVEAAADFYSRSESDERYAPIESALTVSCSGNEMIMLTPTVEWPFRDLKIYGKSTQDSTPSPENPVSIVSAAEGGSVEIAVTGNQLFDGTIVQGGYNHATSDVRVCSAQTLKVVPGQHFALSIKSETLLAAIYIVDSMDQVASTKFIQNTGFYNQNTIIINQSGYFRFAVKKKDDSAITVSDVDNVQIMLNFGDEPLPYEAYTGQSLTLSTPSGLPGITVDSGGDYTDSAGQQWACDVVDMSAQSKTNILGKTQIQNLDWKFSAGSSGVNRFFAGKIDLGGRDFYNLGTVCPCLCNCFVGLKVAQFEVDNTILCRWMTDGSGNRVDIYSSAFSSLDDFTAWLAENPIEIFYVSTPITTPLSDEEIATYRALTTYDGTTIIRSEDSLMQIEAEAVANGSKLIEKKYEETSQKTIDAVFSGIVKENNIDEMFDKWISAADTRNEDLGSLLNRWFSLLEDDYTYGVKFYKFSTSQTPDGTFIDDSAKLGPCTPGTKSTQSVDPYSKRPAFWTKEVAYEIENKEVTIKAISGIRGVTRADILSGKYGMVGVAQKTGWVWDSSDASYYYHRYKVSIKNTDTNYTPLPEAVRPDGTIRSFIVHAKYMAGRKDGKLTSASGLAPVNFISMQNQATEWRNRGVDYCGINGCDIAFRMRMFWLKYGKKGNSGTLEGCSSYNYQKKAAISESGVSRVVLSANDASGYLVGSTVSVGKANVDNIDRGNASMRELADLVKIKSIEDVTIDDTQYKAIVLDTTNTFDTEAGVTYISTMPWHSGSCDDVLGLDGSPTNCTNGKEPFIIQGLESQLGGYAIAADQLTEQILTETEYTHNLVCFREAADISTSITDNAVRSGIKLVMPTDQQGTWLYQGDVEIDKDGNMYPVTVGASSTTGMRASVCVPTAGSRVHAWWVWAGLNRGSHCGLSCGDAGIGTGAAGWNGLAGACGSGANRGEYKA